MVGAWARKNRSQARPSWCSNYAVEAARESDAGVEGVADGRAGAGVPHAQPGAAQLVFEFGREHAGAGFAQFR